MYLRTFNSFFKIFINYFNGAEKTRLASSNTWKRVLSVLSETVVFGTKFPSRHLGALRPMYNPQKMYFRRNCRKYDFCATEWPQPRNLN